MQMFRLFPTQCTQSKNGSYFGTHRQETPRRGSKKPASSTGFVRHRVACGFPLFFEIGSLTTTSQPSALEHGIAGQRFWRATLVVSFIPGPNQCAMRLCCFAVSRIWWSAREIVRPSKAKAGRRVCAHAHGSNARARGVRRSCAGLPRPTMMRCCVAAAEVDADPAASEAIGDRLNLYFVRRWHSIAWLASAPAWALLAINTLIQNNHQHGPHGLSIQHRTNRNQKRYPAAKPETYQLKCEVLERELEEANGDGC
ncbi:uncharacterized protein LOC134209446 [Armigeres subalbatus]|uniref:uncharacterized protein LOC134209446 n=1 Tax=Armigeres subalbatus TaxID=124917 RepID=UPI002ED0776E